MTKYLFLALLYFCNVTGVSHDKLEITKIKLVNILKAYNIHYNFYKTQLTNKPDQDEKIIDKMNEARLSTEEITSLDLSHPYDPTINPTSFIENQPVKNLIKFHEKIWSDKCASQRKKPVFMNAIYF